MDNQKITNNDIDINNDIVKYRIISLLNAPGNITFFLGFDRQLATEYTGSWSFLLDNMTRILMIFLMTFCIFFILPELVDLNKNIFYVMLCLQI